jgi:enolase
MVAAAGEITRISAREVLDCRGLPTVQVDLWLDGRLAGRADVPAGRSTGANEAVELRDGGTRFGGMGVRRAVANVNERIAPALTGTGLESQRLLDSLLLELDGTSDKSGLGANALVGVSLAAARALAEARGVPLYRSLSGNAHVLPVPQVNLINGGRHASNDLDFQEFIVMPVGAGSFMEAMEIATEVNLVLGEVLLAEFGKVALNTGDEGGYAPPMSEPEQALAYLHQSVERAGYADRCVYGLDCAATHFYDAAAGTYRVAGRVLDRDGLISLYEKLVADYGVVSIEDPLHEEDFDGWAMATARTGVQVVGDDLFVTNPGRVERGIAAGSANALLWKVNQIGTLSEALDAAALAMRHGLAVVVSERSGETEDPVIADLAVGLDAGQIKTGAPVRGERTAKYNRLLQIEEELGGSARYAGRDYRRPGPSWR